MHFAIYIKYVLEPTNYVESKELNHFLSEVREHNPFLYWVKARLKQKIRESEQGKS